MNTIQKCLYMKKIKNVYTWIQFKMSTHEYNIKMSTHEYIFKNAYT